MGFGLWLSVRHAGLSADFVHLIRI
jgi:hypothetical protein